ncbi:MAG: HEPN domain-containing protein [archaeon]
MDEKRIKQAEDNFKNYLRDGKITEIDKPKTLIYETYLRNARESLSVANLLFKNNSSSLWVVVSSYYSMFYMACAYLYKLGYKTKHEIVHQVVNEGLIVQGRHKIKNHLLKAYEIGKDEALSVSDNYLTKYGFEKVKRSTFQYETTENIKKSKAQTSLERAKEFLTLIENILEE